MLKNFLNKEQGSITLFVLLAILFFVIVVLSIYISSTNKEQSQNSEVDKIKQEYQQSVENIDQIYEETITENLSNLLKQGDYINYTYDDISDGYSILDDYSGYTSDQTIYQTKGLKWQILNIDTENRTIDILPDCTTDADIYLKGALGYNNGVYILNDICEKQYSNSSLGIKARSINSEDIENQMHELGMSAINSYANTLSNTIYGDTYTYGSNANKYPVLYMKQNGSGINTTTPKRDGISRSDSGNNTLITLKSDIANDGLTVTQTYYSIHDTPSTYFNNINVYNLLFGVENGYWLASRWSNCYPTYADFGIFLIDYNYIMEGKDLFNSTDAENEGDFHIRPVVTIDIGKISLCTGVADGQNSTIEHMHQITENT